MVAWAASGRFPNAGFFCVCVDPDALGTAREFSQLYFKSAPSNLVNGFIDSRKDFPNFQAQLGCQGFVVFDSKHQLVVQSTLPWTQYRDGAFRDLEGKLLRVLEPPAPENPLNAPVGQRVKIAGLASASGAELNGLLGTVVGSSANGSFIVNLGDCTKDFQPENLEDAGTAPVGKHVRVVGLTSEKGQALNGQIGEVRGSADGGCYLVRFDKSTMSLLPANLEEVLAKGAEEEDLWKGVPSVNHEGMDHQHTSCIDALRLLAQTLTVQSLRRARDELASHFEDEETLLRNVGFDVSAGGDCKSANPEFSAFASHVKDHRRIVAIADEALSALSNACHIEGAVPKAVAVNLSRGFVEHAEMYDALYVDKLATESVYRAD